jgi:hypothetical protein
MFRRLIAALAILAFAVSYLPAGIGWCAATEPMSCCTGKMCPMLHHHAAAAKHPDCGMPDMNDEANAPQNSGATMCSCPGQREIHYVAALVFLLAAPPTLISQPPLASPKTLNSFSAQDPSLEIAPPPPRSIPA